MTAVAVTAVAMAAAVAETAGDQRLGAGSESRLLLHAIEMLVSLKSTPHQAITDIQSFLTTQISLRFWDAAAQILAVSSCQIPVKPIECA